MARSHLACGLSRKQLRSDRAVSFNHLLNIDSDGHAHRSTSRDYFNSISLEDEVVEETFWLVGVFYDYDERTAFTADHGMSLNGAHGQRTHAARGLRRRHLVTDRCGHAHVAQDGFVHSVAAVAPGVAQCACAEGGGVARLVRRDVIHDR
jgi:hypothetical protein